MISQNQGLLHQKTPPPGPGRTWAPPFVTGRSDAAGLPMREMQATLVQHPVAPVEAALPAIFKALRLPSGIKPSGNGPLGYRGMSGLSI